MARKTAASPHPWRTFLRARAEAAKWLREIGCDDARIAFMLSTDEPAVRAMFVAVNHSKTEPRRGR